MKRIQFIRLARSIVGAMAVLALCIWGILSCAGCAVQQAVTSPMAAQKAAATLASAIPISGDSVQAKLDALRVTDGLTRGINGGIVDLTRNSTVNLTKPLKIWSQCALHANGSTFIWKGTSPPIDGLAITFATRGGHGFHYGGELWDAYIQGGGVGVDYSTVKWDLGEVRCENVWADSAPMSFNFWSHASYRVQLNNVHAHNPAGEALRINGNGNRVTNFFVNGEYRAAKAPDQWIMAAGYGEGDNWLIEVDRSPPVRGVYTFGDWTFRRFWSEMAGGTQTLVVDGQHAFAKLVEPALISWNTVVARNGAEAAVEGSAFNLSEYIHYGLLQKDASSTITTNGAVQTNVPAPKE